MDSGVKQDIEKSDIYEQAGHLSEENTEESLEVCRAEGRGETFRSEDGPSEEDWACGADGGSALPCGDDLRYCNSTE